MSNFKIGFVILSTLLTSFGCQPKKADDAGAVRYLYIQSGGCYAPSGMTASNPAKTVSRINLTTGLIDRTIADYTASLTDTPVAIAPLDADNMYVLVENSGGRRIEVLNKLTGVAQNFLVNGAALNSVVRSLSIGSDGSLFVNRTSAVERFSSSKSRLPNASTPFLYAPSGNCAASITTITATALTKAGDLMYAHAFGSASTNNRIGITTGSPSSASSCINGYAAPSTTAFPTAMTYIPSLNHLLVAYSSFTTSSNQIMTYTVDESNQTMTQATNPAYGVTSVINGPTAMAYDSVTGHVYIANGTTALANNIEKFTYDPTSETLTRVGTTAFSAPTVHHNCINSMFVGP